MYSPLIHIISTALMSCFLVDACKITTLQFMVFDLFNAYHLNINI